MLIVKSSEFRHKLLLLLQHVTDHLLSVVNVLGENISSHGWCLGLVLGDLLDIITGEPSCLAVQCSFPPPPVLSLSDGDDVSFLELQLKT